MLLQSDANGELYREYRREVQAEPLKRALARSVIVLMVINSAFVLVDWIIYPEKLNTFLPVRIALDAVLLAILFWFRDRYPVGSSFATCFAGGAMLFAVVLGTGGASSDYYVGLVLLFIGIGVLAPLSVVQGSIAIGTLFAIYTTISVVGLGETAMHAKALNLMFLGAAAFVGIMSCAYLERMRFGDFVQRRELKKVSEELKEMDREKSRFTANVHHELRTPLTLMLAPVDMFLSGEFSSSSEEGERYLRSMQKNGNRLLKLINNLLDLAKIEGKQLQIVRRRMDLGPLVTEIVEGAEPFAQRKGIGMRASGLGSVPPIFIDRDAIEKVLVNLVGNALKFSGPGGEVEVEARCVGEEGIEVVVSDRGVGLERDQLEKIFDRFAQADSSNTRRFEGTGIGLSLARELVSLHGGRIWAESDGVDRGTQVHFFLPVGESDESNPSENALLGRPGDGTAAPNDKDTLSREANHDDRPDLRFVELERNADRSRTIDEEGEQESRVVSADASEILVVDDNADMRHLLLGVLGKEFRVRCAENGMEGLRLARAKKPDLVLTDVMMPVMSGTELCAAIKADSGLSSVPVVLVTSKADREMKIEGLERGADDYVTKPFHPRELLARMRSLLRVNELQNQLSVQNALLESANTELESTIGELRDASSRLVQAERLAAVGELAAGVAHEVNNPVNFATNALRTLDVNVREVRDVAAAVAAVNWEDPIEAGTESQRIARLITESGFHDVSDSLAELVEIVTEGLDRTHRLVGDLRDFAAPEQDSDQEVDIARGIGSTIKLLGHMLRDHNIRVVFESACSGYVRGNRRALNQVFLNLIKNAAEAIGDKGGEVQIKLSASDADLVIQIRDDGPGIAEEDLVQVFEPFFSRKSAGHGTGLGLSISQRIVSEHGGDIQVSSSSGMGTEFQVRLPASGRS